MYIYRHNHQDEDILHHMDMMQYRHHIQCIHCVQQPRFHPLRYGWLRSGSNGHREHLRNDCIVSDRISISSCGYVPSITSTTQSRQKPIGTLFSVWQATTQSLHPTHFLVSTAIAYLMMQPPVLVFQ